MVWLLVGALGIAISTEFSLSATQKGLLVAVPLLGGALLRVVVGPLADHIGPKPVGLYLCGLQIVALFLGWQWGTSFYSILGIGLLLGCAGASFAIALPIASQAYPPTHQGLAMGVAAVGNSGVLLATFFAPRLAQEFGWQNTFGLMILPVLLTAISFGFLVKSSVPRPDRSQESLGSIVQKSHSPKINVLAMLYIFIDFWRVCWVIEFLPNFYSRPISHGYGNGRHHDSLVWFSRELGPAHWWPFSRPGWWNGFVARDLSPDCDTWNRVEPIT